MEKTKNIEPPPLPTAENPPPIVSQTPASPADLPAQTSKIVDQLHQQKTRDRATFFQQGLRDSLTASGKLKIHQDVIDRIVASYKTRS